MKQKYKIFSICQLETEHKNIHAKLHEGGHHHQEENKEKDKKESDGNTKDQISTASFSLNDITGIVFGPTSTRFWMYRKHINSIELKNLVKEKNYEMPFFSWECLSLQMKHRDVDLVIKNEKSMDKLLSFLIYSMKSIDGTKNSRIPLEI
jgi:hypothetical protein